MINYVFAKEIGLNSDLILKLISYSSRNETQIIECLKKCSTDNLGALCDCDDMARLGVVLLLLNDTYENYLKLGIEKSIFFDTMSDIAIWCENNENKGLNNIEWIKNHLNCEIFKLGRLQFQKAKISDKIFLSEKYDYSLSNNAVFVHIPQGAKLDLKESKKSLENANDFFAKYFSGFSYDYYLCESWLLYQKNIEFMNKNSNIIKFQSLFDIVHSVPNDKQAIERIFKEEKSNIAEYDEKTSLQRNAKKYMLCGNKLGTGVGVIKR